MNKFYGGAEMKWITVGVAVVIVLIIALWVNRSAQLSVCPASLEFKLDTPDQEQEIVEGIINMLKTAGVEINDQNPCRRATITLRYSQDSRSREGIQEKYAVLSGDADVVILSSGAKESVALRGEGFLTSYDPTTRIVADAFDNGLRTATNQVAAQLVEKLR